MLDISDLQQKGVMVVKNILTPQQLSTLIEKSTLCFNHIENLIKEKGITQVKDYLPSSYNFRETVTSVNVCALMDYSPSIITDIFQRIKSSLIQDILIEIMGKNVKCNIEESWLRKQYSLPNYHPLHHPHSWHQDGCLGLNIPQNYHKKYLDLPLNNLITFWLSLTSCGIDRPGLQFITKPLEKPLHFNYLNENSLRKMFDCDSFWIPQLNAGDGLIFLKGTLHQTYVNTSMESDRISIEFRFFEK
jgi:ectoine hydroxylase-related dioxygenase (phytanoyl-CoA dioxygenase family)